MLNVQNGYSQKPVDIDSLSTEVILKISHEFSPLKFKPLFDHSGTLIARINFAYEEFFPIANEGEKDYEVYKRSLQFVVDSVVVRSDKEKYKKYFKSKQKFVDGKIESISLASTNYKDLETWEFNWDVRELIVDHIKIQNYEFEIMDDSVYETLVYKTGLTYKYLYVKDSTNLKIYLNAFSGDGNEILDIELDEHLRFNINFDSKGRITKTESFMNGVFRSTHEYEYFNNLLVQIIETKENEKKVSKFTYRKGFPVRLEYQKLQNEISVENKFINISYGIVSIKDEFIKVVQYFDKEKANSQNIIFDLNGRWLGKTSFGKYFENVLKFKVY